MVKAKRSHPIVKRKPEKIVRDPSRIITRLHVPEDSQRIVKIIQGVLDMQDAMAETVFAQVMVDFSDRHKDINAVFDQHFDKVRSYISDDRQLTEMKKPSLVLILRWNIRLNPPPFLTVHFFPTMIRVICPKVVYALL